MQFSTTNRGAFPKNMLSEMTPALRFGLESVKVIPEVSPWSAMQQLREYWISLSQKCRLLYLRAVDELSRRCGPKGLVASVLITLLGLLGFPFHWLHQRYRGWTGLPNSGFLEQKNEEAPPKPEHYVIIELWVIGRTFCALVLLMLIAHVNYCWRVAGFIVQASLFADMMRVLLVYHLTPKVRQYSQARSLAALGLHSAEAIFFFASLYLAFQGNLSFSGTTSGRLGMLDALYFSAITITTIGYGDISPRTQPFRIASIIEAFTGIVIIVISISRVMGHNKNEPDDGSASH